MRDFGYSKRAHDVNEANAEIHAAFAEVRNRQDHSDPRTQRWLSAITAFKAALARVYPEALRDVDTGARRARDLDTAVMIDFLEADPMFFGSGYMKERLLTELKRRSLDPKDVARLQAIIIAVIHKPNGRREFRHYCRVAAAIADQSFRNELENLELKSDPAVAQRAKWMLAALDGDWTALARSVRLAAAAKWKGRL